MLLKIKPQLEKAALFLTQPYIVLIACLLFTIKQLVNIEYPIDGDGLGHYFIANDALKTPTFYLHHWGKPLFTLLASPFSIMGHKGILIFNLLIYCITSLVAFHALKKLHVAPLIRAVFPITLLFSFDYIYTVLGGLTEPLAGFLILLSAYFLIEKKWLLFALVAGTLPYCRSEGQLILIVALAILVIYKQWKYIPFLLIASLIYSIIGYFAFKDFLWYFNNDPYAAGSIYGNGSWTHFWENRISYLGPIGFVALLVGLGALVLIVIKRRIPTVRLDLIFFGYSIFFGILFVHAYLWATGQKGSLGLTRTITIGLPVLILVSLYLINEIKGIHRIFQPVFFGLIILVMLTHHNRMLKISKNTGLDTSIEAAAKFVLANKPPNSKVYYHYPLLAMYFNVSPYQNDSIYKQWYFHGDDSRLNALNDGDIIIRDSHLGPVEMGLPLEIFDRNKEWVLINKFIPQNPTESYHGESSNVCIYQKIPLDKQQGIQEDKRTLLLDKHEVVAFNKDDEYKNIYSGTIESPANYLEVELVAKKNGGLIILDINDGQGYIATDLVNKENMKIKYPIKQYDKVKLYLYNPKKTVNETDVLQIQLIKTAYHPIIKF